MGFHVLSPGWNGNVSPDLTHNNPDGKVPVVTLGLPYFLFSPPFFPPGSESGAFSQLSCVTMNVCVFGRACVWLLVMLSMI